MSSQTSPKSWSGRRRWTLATRGYCHICKEQTAQSELHQVDDRGEEHIEARCLVCDQVTSRQRMPALNTQLPLE